MKTKSRFASRSFSASFTIPKSRLTATEISDLMEYNISVFNVDGWTIIDEEDYLRGFTDTDNDALDEYLEKIGFDQRKMEWHNNS